ncbi:MAG TPA: hypothetical protein VEZ46_03060 [Mycobacteriales bacterium]|jgi:hypothetical protein|nr:hypothetical protein [Mycobacteriales bacterium]
MSQRLVDRASSYLESRSSRRSFLMRTAVVGSALAAAPLQYLLKPGTAYAALCGPSASCSSGWTVFCCTINKGVNKCPPGTFVGGWWKIDSSPYCCSSGSPAARYIIDCQGKCKCTTGCSGSDHYCSSGCQTCRCRCGPSGQCDQRRACCNNFRYGQCHQEIRCGGAVACRVVTCTAPYRLYDECGSTNATDNRTRYHNAPCLNGPC